MCREEIDLHIKMCGLKAGNKISLPAYLTHLVGKHVSDSIDKLILCVMAAVTAGWKILYLVFFLCAIVGLSDASGCHLVVFEHPLSMDDVYAGMASSDKRQTVPPIKPRNPITPL